MKRKITRYPSKVMASIDPYSDKVIKGIQKALNVNTEIANIVADFYGNSDMSDPYEDYDNIEDYVDYISKDIYEVLDVLIDDDDFGGVEDLKLVAKALDYRVDELEHSMEDEDDILTFLDDGYYSDEDLTYKGVEFDPGQMAEIRKGLEAGVDVDKYAFPDPKRSYGHQYARDQMAAIRRGLEKGIDITPYVDPRYIPALMDDITEGLENGIDVSIYAKNPHRFSLEQIREIKEGLEAGIDVKKYADARKPWYIMRQIKEDLINDLNR